jgi:hypothetical protein
MSRGKRRFTEAWFARMVRPLFTTFPIGTWVPTGPYTPTMETIPPFLTELIDQCSAVADPPCISSFLPRTVCSALPAASAPTASMHTSAPKESVVPLIKTTGSSSDLKS